MGDLAESGTLGSFTPEQLFSGEMDIVTDSALAAVELNMAQYTVVAKNAAGELLPWVQGGVGVLGIAVGFLAQPIDTTAATGTGEVTDVPFFKGGAVNPDLLVWPVAANTLAERVAAFEGTNIMIRRLL